MSARLLVVASSPALAQTLQGYLALGGFEVANAEGGTAACARLTSSGADVLCVVVSPEWDAEAFCLERKTQSPQTPVLLIYPPDAADADSRAQRYQADGCIVGPLKQGTVISAVRMLVKNRELTGLLSSGVDRSAPVWEPVPNAFEVMSLTRLLSLEGLRARRYGYPFTFMVLGLDFPQQQRVPPALTQALRTEARAQLTRSIRTTDWYAEISDARYGVSLPYAGTAHASAVAERLRARLFGLGGTLLTVSAGLVGLDSLPLDDAPSAALMQAALATLEAAQLAGGDRVSIKES